MTGQKDWFTKLEPSNEPMLFRIANNKLIPAVSKGVIEIQTFAWGHWNDRTINNVLYVPHTSLARNKADKPSEMIHTDVCGLINILFPSGSRFFVLFKNYCIDYFFVYFL